MLRLGEVRSLLPSHIKVLAMTATASKSLRQEISEIIGLVNPLVIAVSSCKPNIIFGVSHFISIPITFAGVLDELCNKLTAMPRMIVNCRRYETVATFIIILRKDWENISLNQQVALMLKSNLRLLHHLARILHYELCLLQLPLEWDWTVLMSDKSFI